MANPKSLYTVDFYSPNFDHFLQLKLENITEYQIGLLEDSVQRKITRHRKDAISYLSLNEKMHILSIAFGHQVVLAVQDSEKGISPKVFRETAKAMKGEIPNSELIELLVQEGIFVMSDKQVMENLLYMSHVETTDIYNLFKLNHPKEKGSREEKFSKKQQILSEVIDTFVQYESVKRKVLDQYKLNIPKFYALLYFYKKERLCKDFYDKQFKYSYCKSRTELSRNLAEMYRLGMLNTRGTTRGKAYSITSKGIDLLIKVLNKLLYDV